MQALEADSEAARLALSRTQVSAPWDATVIQANAVPGQIVSAGQSTATLFPVDFALVEVQVPPQLVQLLEEGLQAIELRPANNPGATAVSGKLDAVVRSLSEQNRLATVRVRVDEPLMNSGWVFGMHLQARLVVTQQHAVAQVPPELVVGGNLVWLYRDGRAVRHQLFPVASSADSALVADNFQVGDRLITRRPVGLFDGVEVNVGRVD